MTGLLLFIFILILLLLRVSTSTKTGNCNCNWGTCIAPSTRRPRAHYRVNLYPGARRQNKTKMFFGTKKNFTDL